MNADACRSMHLIKSPQLLACVGGSVLLPAGLALPDPTGQRAGEESARSVHQKECDSPATNPKNLKEKSDPTSP